MQECDLLVIGAGAAGIAAARAGLAAGRRVQVLEARPRPGGRVVTDHRLGLPFDLGAVWLHAAERNPLVPLARGLGVALVDADRARREVTFVGDRRADAAEAAEYDAAFARLEALAAEAAVAGGPDRPVAAIAPRGGTWDASVAAWHGSVIAGWELEGISLHDFAATSLEGRNLLPAGGFGTLLARLADGLPIGFGAKVDRLAWGGGWAVAEGAFGTLRARAVVCTLPTTLLAAGDALRFDPPLPDAVVAAAAGLPMGAVLKVGFRAAGEDRLDLPDFCSVDRRIEPGEPMVTMTAWQHGLPLLTCWLGGAAAAALEAAGDAAAEAYMQDELARRFGGRARAALAPGAVVSDWLRDPLARGVYSHARVGQAGARAVLARPLAEGRLCLAGEACHASLAGTVAGAWLSGEAAAAAALAAMPA